MKTWTVVDSVRGDGVSRKRGVLKIGVVSAVIALATSVAGCGAARSTQYYQLSVPSEMQQSAANGNGVSLALGPLVASHLYREDRIVYAAGAEQMGTYEYKRWTEPPAEMIHEVLLRELRASGHYREVASQRSSRSTDYVLRGHLYDFKELTGASLAARVTFEFELTDTKSGSVVWSHYYTHDEPVGGKEVPAMVAALDHNVQRGVAEIKAGLEQYLASVPGK
jgi:cholesterol transport system auxiliary component